MTGETMRKGRTVCHKVPGPPPPCVACREEAVQTENDGTYHIVCGPVSTRIQNQSRARLVNLKRSHHDQRRMEHYKQSQYVCLHSAPMHANTHIGFRRAE